jgi:hypothetical protein
MMRFVSFRQQLFAVATLLALPLACVAGALIAGGCAQSPPAHVNARAAGHGVLDTMGFALVDDGDPSTPSGSVTATFNAPVAGSDGTISQPGTAHAAFTNPDGSDDGSKDLASAAIVGAYSDSDVVYAVLFDDQEPWRYVVVAAHSPAITNGADIALDGVNAAALVVDENGADGFLSSSGNLHVDSATLSVGGTFAGSVSATLVEVGLSSWPESLFPLTSDGSPSTRATASGTGTFSAAPATVATDPNAPPSAGGTGTGAGTATVSVDVAGYSTFTGGPASLESADANDSVIVVEAGDASRRMLAIFVENGALTAGTTTSLAGFTAGAELLEDDGSQIAFVDGSLTIDSVASDGTVSGSFTLSGDAYVIPPDASQPTGPTTCDPSTQQCDPSQPTQDCSGLATIAATFTPANAMIQTAQPGDGFPAGFDRALVFLDASGNDALGILLSSDVDLHAGAPYSFSTVDVDGRPMPVAFYSLSTCQSDATAVDSGSITATLDDTTNTIAGSMAITVSGVERDMTFSVSVTQQ